MEVHIKEKDPYIKEVNNNNNNNNNNSKNNSTMKKILKVWDNFAE